MRTRMTFGQWRRSLGEAITLADAAMAVGQPVAALAQAAARGDLAVHRFDGADGRSYFLVRVEDLLWWRRRATPTKLTPQMMGRALERMMAGGRAVR